MRIGLAFRAFFVSLFQPAKAKRIQSALDDEPTAVPKKIESGSERKLPEPLKPPTPDRSDALTLLSALQREARFLDLVNESLDQYSDAQVGAAARDVLRDTKAVLQRMFELKPLADVGEGENMTMNATSSALRFRVVGKQVGADARVVVVHPGWQATRVQLPQWVGIREDQFVLAPIEVEAE